MKFCIALLLFTALLPVHAAAVAPQNPSIHIDDPHRDVGTIIQGETIRQVFGITNKGSATLEIMGVTHS